MSHRYRNILNEVFVRRGKKTAYLSRSICSVKSVEILKFSNYSTLLAKRSINNVEPYLIVDINTV